MVTSPSIPDVPIRTFITLFSDLLRCSSAAFDLISYPIFLCSLPSEGSREIESDETSSALIPSSLHSLIRPHLFEDGNNYIPRILYTLLLVPLPTRLSDVFLFSFEFTYYFSLTHQVCFISYRLLFLYRRYL